MWLLFLILLSSSSYYTGDKTYLPAFVILLVYSDIDSMSALLVSFSCNLLLCYSLWSFCFDLKILLRYLSDGSTSGWRIPRSSFLVYLSFINKGHFCWIFFLERKKMHWLYHSAVFPSVKFLLRNTLVF